jgi:NAD(P)-dependent dehydrogenase (short-subunit alcohol dehydrogenase family)
VVVTNAATDIGQEVCAALEGAGLQVSTLVEHAARDFGCLDALVICPRLQLAASGPAESLSLDAFVNSISHNLSDAFFDAQAAAAQMIAQACSHATPSNRGCIITITSVAGVLALPGHAAFCSAMAGLDVATRLLAAEWGPRGIRVAAVGAGLSPALMAGVLPAGESARRVPDGSLVRPDQVAEAVCFLLSDDADGVAGSTLYVDGGWLADGYWQ